MSESAFPSPEFNDDMKPFFEAAIEGRFELMRCRKCGSWSWPYSGCRNHGNERYLANMAWTEASGRGRVFSYTIAELQFREVFPTPYVFAVVELDEGPLMPSNIIGCNPKAVYVGMRVEVLLERAPSGLVLPKFTPTESHPEAK